MGPIILLVSDSPFNKAAELIIILLLFKSINPDVKFIELLMLTVLPRLNFEPLVFAISRISNVEELAPVIELFTAPVNLNVPSPAARFKVPLFSRLISFNVIKAPPDTFKLVPGWILKVACENTVQEMMRKRQLRPVFRYIVLILYGNKIIPHSLVDVNPSGNVAFYRIAEFDIDGKVQYTSVIRNECGKQDEWRVWPNPVQEQLFVNMSVAGSSTAIIRIFDSKGALVREQRNNLMSGSNQLNVDMRRLLAGTYHVVVLWGNGQIQKAIKIIKQ